jgi:type I restriction enzyme, S subunit
MYSPIQISAFLHRKKETVKIDPNKEYSLVTVKLHHKGVVLREKKKGSLLGSNMYRISKGQFILSGIDARNGAFGIVPDELDGAIVTNDFWYFDVDENKVKRDFFYWLTNTPLFLDACEKSSKGETQRVRLQKELFYNFEFHFPPVEKQKEFLKRFSIIDASLSLLNVEQINQLTYLVRLRQAVLQEAIEGKLTAEWRKKHPDLISGENHASKLLEKIKAEKERLIKVGKIKKDKPLLPITDAEKPFALPDGWAWCRLGNWGFTQTGTTPSTFDTKNAGCFIPFIKPADISVKGIDYSNEGLSEKGLTNGRLILKGSILMVCIGGSIGKSYFAERDVSCNQQINSITPLAGIDPKLLQQFLQSNYFQSGIWDKAMKSSTPIINKGKWETIPLPMPPFTEQQAIVKRVQKIMAMIDEIEKQITERKDQSEMLMQSVLREAFAG